MPPRGPFGTSTPNTDILAALQQAKVATPTEAREGGLIVQAPRITVQEVDTVRTALMHPREKPDTTAFAVSLSSGLVLVGKVIADAARAGQPSWSDMFLFAVGVLLVGATVLRFLGQVRKLHPFHDKALAYIDGLIAEKTADAAKPPPALPPAPPQT